MERPAVTDRTTARHVPVPGRVRRLLPPPGQGIDRRLGCVDRQPARARALEPTGDQQPVGNRGVLPGSAAGHPAARRVLLRTQHGWHHRLPRAAGHERSSAVGRASPHRPGDVRGARTPPARRGRSRHPAGAGTVGPVVELRRDPRPDPRRPGPAGHVPAGVPRRLPRAGRCPERTGTAVGHPGRTHPGRPGLANPAGHRKGVAGVLPATPAHPFPARSRTHVSARRSRTGEPGAVRGTSRRDVDASCRKFRHGGEGVFIPGLPEPVEEVGRWTR